MNRSNDTQTHLQATWLVAKTLQEDTSADKRLGLLQITKSLSPHHRVRVTKQTRKRGENRFYDELVSLKTSFLIASTSLTIRNRKDCTVD